MLWEAQEFPPSGKCFGPQKQLESPAKEPPSALDDSANEGVLLLLGKRRPERLFQVVAGRRETEPSRSTTPAHSAIGMRSAPSTRAHQNRPLGHSPGRRNEGWGEGEEELAPGAGNPSESTAAVRCSWPARHRPQLASTAAVPVRTGPEFSNGPETRPTQHGIQMAASTIGTAEISRYFG